MQKYGILRLYAAKSGTPVQTRTPGWLDRGLVFCWLPLLAISLAPRVGPLVKAQVGPGIEVLTQALLALDGLRFPASLLVVAALFAWVRAEHRANGLTNRPRLSMAAGVSLLS